MNNSHEKKARRIATLLAGYMRDTLTPPEHDELDEWVGASDKNMRLFEELTDERRVQLALDLLNDNNQSGLVKKLKEDNEFTFVNRPFRRYKNVAIAASIAAVAVVGTLLLSGKFFSKQNSSGNLASVDKVKLLDIVPASNKANLILDDDNIVTLNNAENGIIATQGNIQVIKNNGEIRYVATSGGEMPDLLNKVTTPKGGIYKVNLPDGSTAKLNANSSISYPVFFQGNQRRVSITGEVYFEIASAKDKGINYNKPFYVDVNDRNTTVQVLGTHFNVKAYSDEKDIKTTLLEGAVNIEANGNVDSLEPGEQAIVTSDGNIQVKKVETSDDIAWLTNVIKASQGDLRPALNVLCRWYDVDLEFLAGAKNTNLTSSYSGTLNLNRPLQENLNTLKQFTPHAQFEIRGRKIIVTVTPS